MAAFCDDCDMLTGDVELIIQCQSCCYMLCLSCAPEHDCNAHLDDDEERRTPDIRVCLPLPKELSKLVLEKEQKEYEERQRLSDIVERLKTGRNRAKERKEAERFNRTLFEKAGILKK